MTTLRALMPVTARRIDRMREQLGKDVVNDMLRKAIAGRVGISLRWKTTGHSVRQIHR
jgi:hypothetical protein